MLVRPKQHTCFIWIVFVPSLLQSPRLISRILVIPALRVLSLLLLIRLLVTTSSGSCRWLLVKGGSQLAGLLWADIAQPLAGLAQGQHAGSHHLHEHHTAQHLQCATSHAALPSAYTSLNMGLRQLVLSCLGC
jgi:hypothetical protein